jgi:hypothetical protein
MANKPQPFVFDMTVPVPMLVPALEEAVAYQEDGKEKGPPKFGAMFLFSGEHPDLPGIKKKMMEAASSMFPGEKFPREFWPVTSGSERIAKLKAADKTIKPYVAAQEGKAVLQSRSKYPPMVSYIVNGKLTEVVSTDLKGMLASRSHFFSGAEVLASFNFVPGAIKNKDGSTSKYLAVYLNKVFSTGKGERVGGWRSAAEAFKGYIGHASQEDPTAGDEDIPF